VIGEPKLAESILSNHTKPLFPGARSGMVVSVTGTEDLDSGHFSMRLVALRADRSPLLLAWYHQHTAV